MTGEKKPYLPRHHCGGCTARWTGARMCHCTGCHRTFTGITVFDQHQTTGGCRMPRALTEVRPGVYGTKTDPVDDGEEE